MIFAFWISNIEKRKLLEFPIYKPKVYIYLIYATVSFVFVHVNIFLEKWKWFFFYFFKKMGDNIR